MRPDIDAIAARSAAATPGPWRWYGNVDTRHIYLATTRWGRQLVMGFKRWGMRGAQPTFHRWEHRTPPDDPWRWSGYMDPASEMARREVPYRGDIAAIENPDAEFIAHARTDIPALLDYIRELERGPATGPHCPACFPPDAERPAAPSAEAAPLPPGVASAESPAVAA